MSSGLTAAMAQSAAGANGKIRVAVLGAGTRGSYMVQNFAENDDCDAVAVCELWKDRREKTVAALPGNPDTYEDYRRVLERQDIDAVLIATPDHWHARMTIEACQAGKDVYVEKPACRHPEEGLQMIETASQHKRVVQVGLQQRSWDHFQKCAAMVQSGMFGKIYHAGLHWQGSYNAPPQEGRQPPEDFNWELFQGPAPRRPYTPRRARNWRTYYDYAGGIVTDQGVHIGDVVHWYMKATAPLSVCASAQWVNATPQEDQIPDSFMISWTYPGFIMSFTNAFIPNPEYDATHGNYFYGRLGSLHVNRPSYTLKANPPRGRVGEKLPQAAFEDVAENFRYYGEPADKAHVRNFLDCVKSREKPLTDVEIGVTSTIPLLLGVLAIRTGKAYTWNGKEAVPISA